MKGTVLEISEQRSFLKKSIEYKYRTVVVDVGVGIIAANYWLDGDIPPVGTDVNFVIKITSERNNKDPELFYHKVNLHKIYESSRIPQEVQY